MTALDRTDVVASLREMAADPERPRRTSVLRAAADLIEAGLLADPAERPFRVGDVVEVPGLAAVGTVIAGPDQPVQWDDGQVTHTPVARLRLVSPAGGES